MSARNSLAAKRERRGRREVRHAGYCAIGGRLCGEEMAWCNAKDPADPSYRAICQRHLAYAVATIFGYEGPGTVVERPMPRRPRPDTSTRAGRRKIAERRLREEFPRAGKGLVGSATDTAIAQARKRRIGEALNALYGHPPPTS